MSSGSGLERFDLLASGVAGRRVWVQAAVASEPLAYSDGRVIFLPQPASDGAQDQVRAVLAQALLISAGSLHAAVLRRLIGRPTAARRYAWLEVLRACAYRRERLPLMFVRHAALIGRPPLTDSAMESSKCALKSQAPIGDIPDFVGSVRPLATLRAALSGDALASLGHSMHTQSSPRRDDQPELSDHEETESSAIVDLFGNSLAGANPLSDWFKGLLGMRSGSGREEQPASNAAGAEMPVSRVRRVWRRGVHAMMSLAPPAAAELLYDGFPRGRVYPEWDVARGRYRKGWVSVHEIEPFRPDGPRDVRGVLAAAPRELHRQLSHLGLDFEMSRRQREGSDLDVGRLIEWAIEMRAGLSGTIDDVYRASRKTRRDLGVVVVVDVSGSTAESNVHGESVFHAHLRAGYQLSRTLDRLGDRVALYGFQSWGRRIVQFARLKEHGEVWSGLVGERFACLETVGYTRIGAAIRHADHILRTSMRLPHRLLLLITDGFSYDQDYEAQYAESDTRKALREARGAGTACLCLCIGGGQSTEKLAAVFGESNLLVVDDVRQMYPRIRELCSKALTSVARRQTAGRGAYAG